jgi:hypothetical protein
MDGKRFEDLPNTRDLESLPRRIMSDFKLRISKLAMDANECRRQWRNESEWRDELEPKVFQRFDEEFNWSAFYVIFWRTEKIIYFPSMACNKHLWISEFQAFPNDRSAAETSTKTRETEAL